MSASTQTLVGAGVEWPLRKANTVSSRDLASSETCHIVPCFDPKEDLVGIAQCAGLGRHQLVTEGLDHRAQEVRVSIIEVLAQPGQSIHRVGDFDRIFSFVFFGRNLKIDAVVVASGGPRETPVRRRDLYPGLLASAPYGKPQRVKPVHHAPGRERTACVY